jgi:hypothetical protein
MNKKDAKEIDNVIIQILQILEKITARKPLTNGQKAKFLQLISRGEK